MKDLSRVETATRQAAAVFPLHVAGYFGCVHVSTGVCNYGT